MTYDLQLRKGGTLIFQEWDSDISEYIERDVELEDIPFHFNSSICLSAGTTLKDIFLLVSKSIELFSTVTGCPYLDELVAEALSKAESGEKDIGALELKRIAIVQKSELFFHFDFHGLGDDETYAIEFTPLNKLVTVPLILNEDISLEDSDTEEVYLKCKMTFSLFDILFGIVEELSFMGPPNIRAMALDELKGRVDDIKEGKVETTSWEDIRKKLEEKAERHKIPCKICGKDAREQCFDKPSDICVACFEHIKEN
jgi:hypothetical protein